MLSFKKTTLLKFLTFLIATTPFTQTTPEIKSQPDQIKSYLIEEKDETNNTDPETTIPEKKSSEIDYKKIATIAGIGLASVIALGAGGLGLYALNEKIGLSTTIQKTDAFKALTEIFKNIKNEITKPTNPSL